MKIVVMIYHYCNTCSFDNIISTKEIWLTDITKLNDPSEYRSGFDLILEVLKGKGLIDKPQFQKIHPDELNRGFQILVGCFSRERDDGTQWRLYADDTKGLSIGFDENDIEQYNLFSRFTANNYNPITSHVNLFAVYYDSSEFVKKVTGFIEKVEKNKTALKDQLIALALRRFAALYKDPFFKGECEVRAIVEIESDWDDKYTIDTRVNAYEEKASYHKMLISYHDLSAIKEVIIGANCPYTQEDVEGILHEHGLDSVTVHYSSGRGKYRTAPER